MKLRYIVDIDIDEEDTEMEFKLREDLYDFVKDHEYGCMADSIDVKLQDEFCLEREKQKKKEKQEYFDELQKAKAEIERLNAKIAERDETNFYTMGQLKLTREKLLTAKSEARNEFAEKLKKQVSIINGRCVVSVPRIDFLKDTMDEEEKFKE